MQWNDYAGVIHLHSNYSFDGRTPVPAILEAARKNNLDFLMLTDHSTIGARTDGFEGWNKGVLLIVGEEIAPRFNHYLAFGHPKAVDCAEKEPDLLPQTYIDRVKALGGFGFIAHPDHAGASLFHVKHYPWQDWSVNGYTGLGIWDFMTDWQNSLTGYVRAILSYISPAFFLRGPCPSTLERWDRMAMERAVVGIGELDNHDTLKKLWGISLSVFPFTRVFNLIRTHILASAPLSGDDKQDIATILNTLRQGQCYVSLDYFQSAHGFSMTLSDEKDTATMGGHFSLGEKARLQASFPGTARIRLLRNGKIIRTESGNSLEQTIHESGCYRIEAYIKAFGMYRPWIFSNPIYVVKRT